MELGVPRPDTFSLFFFFLSTSLKVIELLRRLHRGKHEPSYHPSPFFIILITIFIISSISDSILITSTHSKLPMNTSSKTFQKTNNRTEIQNSTDFLRKITIASFLTTLFLFFFFIFLLVISTRTPCNTLPEVYGVSGRFRLHISYRNSKQLGLLSINFDHHLNCVVCG